MKVVLFCGGFGTRLREYSETIPKPLATIGHRPIIWHLMKYYAAHGHKEFILCLGYRGDMIKEYFINYKEYISNDFVLSEGGNTIELAQSDISEWKIHFIDTGLNSNIGERLKAVQHLLDSDEMFLANYSDGLSDLPLQEHIGLHRNNNAVATFISVRPSQSFHAVEFTDTGLVTGITHVGSAEYWINGGFFVLNKEIFDFMKPGEELVERPFERLLAEKRLYANKYTRFWAAMDTYKDKKRFDEQYEKGDTPWMVWQ